MAKAEIPVISFEPFLKGDSEQRKAVADQIYRAFHDIGFLYLKDSGILQGRVDSIFTLARQFFDLPLDFKKRYTIRDPAENQGYSPKLAGDHRESYEHRRFTNELCPTSQELTDHNPEIANFQVIMDEFYKECFALSEQVLKCLALSLGLPGGEHYFDSMMERSDPQLRIMHYPPVPAASVTASRGADDAGEKRAKPHCDYGFCTLLFQDGVGGLEVDPFHTGNYIAAKPIPGTVLINIGDLLHRLLNGRVKSTLHRVVAPAVEVADESGMLPSRYSIPFFVHPDERANINPIVLSDQEEQLYKGVNAGIWRAWRTSRFYNVPEKEKYFLDQLGIAHELVRTAIIN
ncbi:uncharacterized protein PV07_10839 [Cladophialophora immunda]|uniref:Fe2OG dioxygenase domain-containing protein n=1 Tax=Cladophialophora immunda TaxID=569365 RepID=A0A0D2C3W8_9EURO|nr:uncharacterized protein PV07_10839 [Cladophialophora immunda]KIW25180.1 hypothetical protein PV07_10839 [Cladophialophora immunda]OQU96403.1 hypothetical protein CLAIMM_02488 [Cladophialophora immunda]